MFFTRDLILLLQKISGIKSKMNSNDKRIAFFKHRTVNSQPLRPGAIQINRNCSRCITKQDYKTDKDFDSLITTKSFDNLVSREGTKFSQYQSIQYHTGQTEVLKCSLNGTIPTVYIVGVTDHKDLGFLDRVLKHVSLDPTKAISASMSAHDLVDFLKDSEVKINISLAVPIQVRSCASASHLFTKIGEPCFKVLAIRDLMSPLVDLVVKDASFDLNIVNVSITKEHDDVQFYGLGSICIEISEAFSLQTYISRLQIEDKSTHLVQHICFDVSRISAVFAPHLVAFIILYAERDNGIKIEDIITTIDWFRKSSIDTDLQIGFTGHSHYAVEFALIILKDYIQFDRKSSVFRAKNPEKLQEYANLVIPRVAFLGIISKAVLMEFRKYSGDQTIVSLTSQYRIRVMKENVMDFCIRFVGNIERFFPCRRPCTTVEHALSDALTQMETFGKYLKVEEPQTYPSKMRYWAGDDDDDDDDYYYRNRNNPSLKTWLVLTQRQYRLDRLNMFINSIDDFIAEIC